jgi:hypothetical protein
MFTAERRNDVRELEAWDPTLRARLAPPLREFGATHAVRQGEA